jgi:tetratricopeptide (TPR) repeat protein
MDCRGAWVLALVLLTGGVGCVQTNSQQVGDNHNGNDLAQQGGKKPSANLYLAQGRLFEGNSRVADVPPQLQQSMRDQARMSYSQALDQEPKNLEALLSLARLAEVEGDNEHVKQYLTRAAQEHPKEAVVWYQAAMYHAKCKEFQQAIENLKHASQLAPQNREVTITLGRMLARAGQIDQSVACLTKVMGNARAHYDVGRMLAHLQRPEESRRQLELALQYKADFQPARDLLAQLEGGRPPDGSGLATVGFQAPAE